MNPNRYLAHIPTDEMRSELEVARNELARDRRMQELNRQQADRLQQRIDGNREQIAIMQRELAAREERVTA